VIASITRGKDAGALGVYLHGPGRHNEHAYNARVAGMVIAGSIPVTDPTKPGQWVANMRRAYRGRDDVARPVWQCSLRTAPGDRRLSDAEWADAAQVFAERLGFDHHPWVAVRHADDHIHLALSRVAHDGRVWLGRHDYRTTQDARRELETELGLVQAPLRRGVSSERTEITQVQPGEYRMFTDAGQHPPRAVLAGQVLAAANTAAGQGRAVFEAELTERGIDFAVNQASTGTVSGYRFAAPAAAHADHNGEQVWFKASQLDKKLAWRQLSKVLEPLPQVLDEKEFTRHHDAELEQRAQQARAGRIADQWAQTGYPPVEQVGTTLTEARTHLDTLDPQLTAARGVVEQQVREPRGSWSPPSKRCTPRDDWGGAGPNTASTGSPPPTASGWGSRSPAPTDANAATPRSTTTSWPPTTGSCWPTAPGGRKCMTPPPGRWRRGRKSRTRTPTTGRTGRRRCGWR